MIKVSPDVIHKGVFEIKFNKKAIAVTSAIKKIVKWDRNRDFLKLLSSEPISPSFHRDLIGLERHQASINLKTNGQRKSRTVKLNSKTYDTNALFNMLSSIIIFWIFYILQSVLSWQKMHEFKLSLSENTDGIKMMQMALRNAIYLTCFWKCDIKGFQIEQLCENIVLII